MKHAISRFEIPSTDIDRAQKFYEIIFGITMHAMDAEGRLKMRIFPVEDMMTGIGGAIVDSGGFHKPPLTEGVLIYLNGNPDLRTVLDKVEAAGGKVPVPKTQISPEHGYKGVFADTEGNRVGLHSI